MIGTDEHPLFDEAISWEEALKALAALDLSDGLPLVPPTRRRVERMLAEVGDRERSHGQLAPMFGEITAEAVAYQCVLAGCEPHELPVVLTALVACTAPEFNLLGIQTTTGTPTAAVVVHGPIAKALGMNAGTNCLGPGNRANACIGRAVQLCLVNIGGAKPGVGDMATMGQPGKYAFCFAEGEDPLVPPLHVRRGFKPGDSAVTVLGVSGTLEVLPVGGRDTPESVLEPVLAAMIGARRAAGKMRSGEQFFLLPNEMAALIAKGGWDLAAMQDFLYRTGNAAVAGDGGEAPCIAGSAGDIHPIVTGGPGVKMTYPCLWMGGTQSVTAALLRP